MKFLKQFKVSEMDNLLLWFVNDKITTIFKIIDKKGCWEQKLSFDLKFVLLMGIKTFH